MLDTLIKRGWKTPNTYANHYASLEPISAIYMLVLPDKNYKVAYVGKSTKLNKRIEGHEIKSLMEKEHYVQVWFRPVPNRLLSRLERFLIWTLNPPYNIMCRKRGL